MISPIFFIKKYIMLYYRFYYCTLAGRCTIYLILWCTLLGVSMFNNKNHDLL